MHIKVVKRVFTTRNVESTIIEKKKVTSKANTRLYVYSDSDHLNCSGLPAFILRLHADNAQRIPIRSHTV